MSAPLIIAMPGNEAMAASLARYLDAEPGQLELRTFPDGESYLRFHTDVSHRDLAILCTLDRPNEKILPLLFSALTARELGAARIGLIAPYLAYMRQDRRFRPGEAVTSREFARLLSGAFDWLVTVDPHLHRYGSLAEIYSIPACAVHAAPLLSRWIKANVANPFLIGPDRESEQWISAVAKDAGSPYAVLEKIRRGDRDVEISVKNLGDLAGRTPVLVDDIISSGRTMIEAVRLLAKQTAAAPVCVAIHGIFADKSDRLLARVGARVVTSNSIPHATNAIDVTQAVAQEIRRFQAPCD
ncbi:MAG: ribose-phosphate pyrophosphokinase [Xanthobacteraceae bacterium]